MKKNEKKIKKRMDGKKGICSDGIKAAKLAIRELRKSMDERFPNEEKEENPIRKKVAKVWIDLTLWLIRTGVDLNRLKKWFGMASDQWIVKLMERSNMRTLLCWACQGTDKNVFSRTAIDQPFFIAKRKLKGLKNPVLPTNIILKENEKEEIVEIQKKEGKEESELNNAPKRSVQIAKIICLMFMSMIGEKWNVEWSPLVHLWSMLSKLVARGLLDPDVAECFRPIKSFVQHLVNERKQKRSKKLYH